MQDIFQGKEAKKTAIIHGGKSISYGALRALTKEYTDYFQAHGLQAGDVVLFVMPLSIRFYAALIALISMGARAFILDSLDQGRFSQAINKGGARHLLVEILGKPRVIPLFSRSERPNSRKSKLETKGSLMTFTSGTTSLKIIERSADFLQAQAKILDDSLKLAESKVILTTLPVFVLAHLYYGVTTILSDKNTVDLRQILKEKPDKIIAAPHYLGLLTEVVSKAKVALPALKEILVGGAPVFPRLAGKVLETLPDVAFTAVYGSSEAEPIAHLHITKESLHLVSEIACAGGGSARVDHFALLLWWQKKNCKSSPGEMEMVTVLAGKN
jgi:Acyl-CoA synthetases (AMP-forming)/AMP-acid ligases II